jgi:hypothetical protein
VYKSKRYGWLVDSTKLTKRQNFASIVGMGAGLVVGLSVGDVWFHGAFWLFLVTAVCTLAGSAIGLYLTRADFRDS